MAGQRKSLGSLIATPDPAPAAPRTRPDKSARPDKPARSGVPEPSAPAGEMTMRSWYMPKASAERLAALVDDVHFAPFHLVCVSGSVDGLPAACIR